MRQIFLLRHGAVHLSGRYIGVTDVELSDKGKKQVKLQAPFIAGRIFSTILCSPLKRCVQTKNILPLSGPVECDQRLREIDFGLWECKSFAEIVQNYPTQVADWSCSKPGFSFPDGEKLSDFQIRIQDFSDSIESLPSGDILIISHGGVIRHLICALLHLPFDNYLYFQVDYGKFATIQLHSEGGILTGLNRGIEHG